MRNHWQADGRMGKRAAGVHLQVRQGTACGNPKQRNGKRPPTAPIGSSVEAEMIAVASTPTTVLPCRRIRQHSAGRHVNKSQPKAQGTQIGGGAHRHSRGRRERLGCPDRRVVDPKGHHHRAS